MICCCTEHRPKGFTWKINDKQLFDKYRKLLKNMIVQLIDKYDIKKFISGMALGADTDFAETIIQLKEQYKIKLLCALPCKNQCLKWNSSDIMRYKNVLKKADEIEVISQQYTSTCMYERNKFMVDNSNIVLAIWNGNKKGGTWQTINYAKSKQKQIVYIRLDKIEDMEVKI